MRGDGGCGVSANEYSCAHQVTWSPNKLWRSTSINLCHRPLKVKCYDHTANNLIRVSPLPRARICRRLWTLGYRFQESIPYEKLILTWTWDMATSILYLFTNRFQESIFHPLTRLQIPAHLIFIEDCREGFRFGLDTLKGKMLKIAIFYPLIARQNQCSGAVNISLCSGPAEP